MSPEELEIPDAAYAAGEQAAVRYVAEGDALDVASDVLHAAVPLDRARELRQMVTELEALQVEMCETDNSRLRSSGVGEAILHLRVRAACLGGGVE